ncbi:hypothetical protein V1514DRAFT_276680 [Lipomyces japonicus]|uniref:uncharacterized protein n=1 Tax=Lipomyces japonicus TaxID=56871 RepID=UPI0034CDEBC0
MLDQSKIKLDLQLYDTFIIAHADSGDRETVTNLVAHMKSQNISPGSHTYAHLLRLSYKLGDFDLLSKVMAEIRNNQIQLTLDHYGLMIKICVKTKHTLELFKIFDLLKFQSVQNQPNEKIYVTMIKACGDLSETEKAIDLYREMTSRPINPIEPSAVALEALAYACAKRTDYQFHAWDYLRQAIELGGKITTPTIALILSICAYSGNHSYCRAVITKLCLNETEYPDSIMFGILMRAYSVNQQGAESSNVDIGSQLPDPVKRHLLPAGGIELAKNIKKIPPFLPPAVLKSVEEIIEESRAVMKFLVMEKPKLINEKLVNNYLQVAVNHEHYGEFRSRFAEVTTSELNLSEIGLSDCAFSTPVRSSKKKISVKKKSTKHDDSIVKTDPQFNRKVFRNHYIYHTALQAAYAVRDVEFAKEVYREREAWKTTPAYSSFSTKVMRKSDYTAAKIMLNILSRGERFDEALKFFIDNKKTFPWIFNNLKLLLTKAAQCRKFKILKSVQKEFADLEAYRKQYAGYADF